MGLGDRIKVLRGHENQTDFGARFGASRNTVMRYENETSQPDASFLVTLCEHYNVSPTWLLAGEGPMHVEPRHRETESDLAKDLLLGDKDAARRRAAKVKELGGSMRAARETTNLAWQEIGGDALPEPRTDTEKQLATALAGLRARYEAEAFGRLTAEQQADALAARSTSAKPYKVGEEHPDRPPAAEVDLSKGVELLAKIYGAGNQVLIRAIIANLLAFVEAIENAHRAEDYAQDIRELKAQNTDLLNRVAALEQRLAAGDSSNPKAEAA